MPAGALPPAPPPSPSRHCIKQGGLVSGTGRLKHVKRRQQQLQQQQQPPPQPTQPLTPREQFARVYSFTLPPPPPQREDPQFRRSSSHCASSAPSCPSTFELLAKFNALFVHSRTQSSTTAPEPPATPTKRERSILPPGVEGNLIVPDVKLKDQCSSTVSLESPPSRRSPSSKKSPLSAPSTTQGFDRQEVYTSFTLKRPTFESRSWSYDNVLTYPIMQLPPKKEIRIVKKIVDGEEKEVEIEVEVYEEPKKLFNFAPRVVLR